MYAVGANFTSLLFVNVYRIYILLVWFDEKGENYFWVYLCSFVDDLTIRGREIWSFIYACLCIIFLFHTKREKRNLRVLYMHVYVIYMHIYFFFNWYQSIYVLFSIGIKAYMLICVICFMHTLNIFIVHCYAWVKGELLWSLTLIHAYITPWVFSSSKRGRLLAQRPITLVLMMINSYSYILLIILWYLASDIWSGY